jgi:acyl carrier protein
MTEEQAQKLSEIVQRALNLEESPPEGTSLKGLGLDSMALFNLIEELESTFGIKVEEDEVLPGHFDTLHGLTTFLDAKLSTGV